MSLRRRELVTGAAALAALGRVAPAAAKASADAEPLARLVGIEQEASLLYGTLDAPRVPGREFRAQSREHARGLGTALRNRGGRAPAPKARVGRATPQQALALEERALAAYAQAIGEVRDASLLPTLAAAMANHGQHAVVLRQALGRDPIPAAFPGGAVR
jgi:hypothetical protein